MSDDQWRRGDPDPVFDDDDFGPVRFSDDDETGALEWEPREPLSFDDEVPAAPPRSADEGFGRPLEDDDLDVWSSFTATESEEGDYQEPEYDEAGVPREPARIQIGTDPTDEGRRMREGEDERPGRSRAPRAPRDTSRPLRGAGRPPRAPGGGRDMPAAVGMGVALGAVFVLLIMFAPPWTVMAFAVVILGLGAVEFFDKTSERGYQPATVVGIVAVAAGPAAGYLVDERGPLLVVAFAFMASALAFIGAPGLQSGPLPNMAITNLGVVYLGLLGSFAGLILRYSTGFGFENDIGTDTLMLVAVGVVASDVGALFVGSAAGRTPLREWISPNKTVEGFVGGLVFSVAAVSVGCMVSDTWNGQVNALVLGVGIGILAPLGDLAESMFKRNLDIKDFGTLLKGHGGVLDRFDGFLFALPFAYYAMTTLEPWTYVK